MSNKNKMETNKKEELTLEKMYFGLMKKMNEMDTKMNNSLKKMDTKMNDGFRVIKKEISLLRSRNGEFDEGRIRRNVGKIFGKPFAKGYVVKSLFHVLKLLKNNKEKSNSSHSSKISYKKQIGSLKSFVDFFKRIDELLRSRLVDLLKNYSKNSNITKLTNAILENNLKDIKNNMNCISGNAKSLVKSFFSTEYFGDCMGNDCGSGFAKLLVLCSIIYEDFSLEKDLHFYILV